MLKLKNIIKVMLIAGILAFIPSFSGVYAADEGFAVDLETQSAQDAAAAISAQKDEWSKKQAELNALTSDTSALGELNRQMQAAASSGDTAAYNEYRIQYEQAQQERQEKISKLSEEIKQLQKEITKADNALEKQLDKDTKAAEKELKSAQKNVDTYCGTGKDADSAKCQEAQTAVSSAQQKLDNIEGTRASAQQKPQETASSSTSATEGSAYSATAEEADAARKAYNDAKNAYAQAQIELNTQKATCSGDGCQEKIAELEKAVEEAKTKTDEAYKDYYNKNKNAAPTEKEQAKTELDEAQQAVDDAQNKIYSLKAQLDEANRACEYSSTLTSKAGQADAQKYCSQANALEAAYTEAQADLIEAEEKRDEAQSRYNTVEGEVYSHEGQIYQAIPGTVNEALYKNTGDILTTITRRAAWVIVSLKPIVYIFAGFGLIGFAFMAIFNKLSWKWFANIAIGLFLVANMGRFIEYFVYPTPNPGYTEAQKTPAFKDYLQNVMVDSQYQWIDEISPYIEPTMIENMAGLPQGAVLPEYEAATRGFCGRTTGATGWGNFTNCINDIVSAGKKAVDTAKKVQNTVDRVENTVEQVGNAAQNIGNAVKNIDSLEDAIKAVGDVGSNVNNMIGSTGGMVDGVMSNISDISNNVQDVTKSTDQVAELEEKRARGEGTNAIDRLLKGQTAGADGEVERLYAGSDNGQSLGHVNSKGQFIDKDGRVVGTLDKDGNIIGADGKPIEGLTLGVKSDGTFSGQVYGAGGDAVKGDIATSNNFFTQLGATTDDVVDKSKTLNSKLQTGTRTATAGVETVTNFSVFGSKTINERRQEKQIEEQRRQREEANLQRQQEENGRSKSSSGSQTVSTTAVTQTAPAVTVSRQQTAPVVSSGQTSAQTPGVSAVSKANSVNPVSAETAAAATAATARTVTARQTAPVAAVPQAAPSNAVNTQKLVRENMAENTVAPVSVAVPQQTSPNVVSRVTTRAFATPAVVAEKAQPEVLATERTRTVSEVRQQVNTTDELGSSVSAVPVATEANLALQSQYARQKLSAAVKAAEAAETAAVAKEKQAKQAAAVAQTAMEKATQSGSAADKRAAEQAQKRADLALREAQTARKTAEEAQKPLSELQKASHEADAAEISAIKESAQKQIASYNKQLSAAKEAARIAVMAAHNAQEDARQKIQAAGNGQNAAAVSKAQNASELAARLQQDAMKAQKEVDDIMKSINEAEARYQAALARETISAQTE